MSRSRRPHADPVGAARGDLQLLVDRGQAARGRSRSDEVVDVLRRRRARRPRSSTAIARPARAQRHRARRAEIAADLATTSRPRSSVDAGRRRPPPSVEAELHEAADAAADAGRRLERATARARRRAARPAAAAAGVARRGRAGEPRSSDGGSSDPVRMYLKEIGKVPLLTGAAGGRRWPSASRPAARRGRSWPTSPPPGELDDARVRRAAPAAAHRPPTARTAKRAS